ncbi:lipoyl(octanoyl) transferase LipB [Rhodoblastus acidophilus]|uniref:Octanoyltransferase n=1 Tax=Rhodoblastus acidophilus TaxID=1074 RepID=A0A6N8DKL5_RHOAC|nr:lipoyl(octanoyl) transferase LipB [Rhodoblastus acidophilus]MCW2273519.1 lipoyl(octanoyl) transferase [Rhodoblastus acidophilus]MTV30396.1 lipoyl(octanoyl) transferase LipB [Rhodoblastus acidophilus]
MSESRETLSKNFLPTPASPPVDWIVAEGLTDYALACKRMEDWAGRIADGSESEKVWLVEHPPLYTAGTSAKPQDLLTKDLPVFDAGRGGQYTYHGPGQRVAYVLLDLSRRRRDVRAFVGALEAWLIAALALFNIKGFTREDRVGVWTARPDKPPGPNGEPAEDKIAAIGVRLRRWVSFHGISINVEPDLRHFAGIVPCGIFESHLGVTSLVDLGLPVTMPEVDMALRQAFEPIFGATRSASGADS